MAEDPQLSARPTDGKRKYEDQTPTPPSSTRRPTGFSAPIASLSPDSHSAPPPSSYNSVPVDEIQAAKQRAQEIAARLFSSAEAKRPRLENGGTGADDSNGNAFGSATTGNSQVRASLSTSIPTAYGFQGASKKIDIPNGKVGVIIGKSGETIKYLQLQSGAKIQVTRDMDADPTSLTRPVELIGTPEQVSKAEQLISDVLAEAEAGSSGIVAGRRVTTGQTGVEHFTMKVPNNKVGLIIGKGGETIKNMQARSGARIQLIPLHLPPGDASTERTVHIDGTEEQIESAKQLVNEVVSEVAHPGSSYLRAAYIIIRSFLSCINLHNRLRNPPMSGGYSQQGYRPPQPSTNWGPPGQPPMQQPGYGYMQPGAYPGPPPQYMSQPPYTGYPPQPTSAGYSSGWDQTPVPPNQQTAPGSGYDYYGQQSQQQQPAPGVSSTPGDNTSYNYSQPPASNYTQGSYGESNYSQPAAGQQGYSQDGYGAGYHAPAPQPGYAPPQSNPQPGYDQQQGYNSAPTYGSVVSSNQDGATTYGTQAGSTQVPPAQQVPPPTQPPGATQVYTGQQPANPASYPPQGSTQPGYGIPPTSQPGYGSQPLAQTGYAAQPGYGQPQGQKPPPTQAVYGQTQQPPTTQGGYVQPAPIQTGYSQPPAQSGYAQQDSGHHRAPPAGYGPGASQPGYGQPQSHGAAPPVAQTGFGQQQSQQPYGSGSYGGGYSQPPVYSAENAVASGAQPVVPSGVAKASPHG